MKPDVTVTEASCSSSHPGEEECPPLTQATSQAPTIALAQAPGRPPVEVTRPAARAIRSWGWELHRLCQAAELLQTRLKRGSLRPDVAAFVATNQPSFSTDALRARLREGFSQRLLVRGNQVLAAWDSLEENGVPAGLIALFRLPALREFWTRALRRTHHQRLKRELPLAWFVTRDPLPPGAVVPGLGAVEPDHLPAADSRFVRVSTADGQILIETPSRNGLATVTAQYEHRGGRIELGAAATDS